MFLSWLCYLQKTVFWPDLQEAFYEGPVLRRNLITVVFWQFYIATNSTEIIIARSLLLSSLQLSKKHVQNTQFWKAPCCDDTKCTATSLRLVATSACRCWSESLYGRKKDGQCVCVSESLLWPCLVLDNWSSMSAPLSQELNKNIC